MNKGRIYFNHSPKPTIGVEAELFTINKDSLDLCPGSPLLLDEFPDIILSAINDLEKGMVAVL
jgi:gamma-glutamyl:cysteine ligase YbdK (ATP-grasp superfamily)